MKTTAFFVVASSFAVACEGGMCRRVAALDGSAWKCSDWISAVDAPVADGKSGARAADGVSWFVRGVENDGEVEAAVWMTTGLGVYELYVNGERIGEDALKPGYTHVEKTRRSFTYDVTACMKRGKGAKNFFAAEVSSGWWRDRIVKFFGKKSAFRSVLKIVYADGSEKIVGTRPGEWAAGVAGPIVHAAIYDGEEFDARSLPPFLGSDALKPAERNNEFRGEILPSEGGEVVRRLDLALKPVFAYVWRGADGAKRKDNIYGRVHRLRDVKFGSGECALAAGETLVVDFGQNCAGVPVFRFKAAEGTRLTCLPGEMLNDGDGERSRGNDGPAGSVYRANLRMQDEGMRIVYTFGTPRADGKDVEYFPTHSFFGYRYVSITATGDVAISSIVSLPVSSIAKGDELGRLETGVQDVNQLISNVYWGQLSNYLSVPTDCPQRNERLGWTADTQVFAEAGSFNADTAAFMRKWMRDMRDSQHKLGGFPGVAPWCKTGGKRIMAFGWADAAVIVPYQMWKQFGDVRIVGENWNAMERFVKRVDDTKYDFEATKEESGGCQWADWLAYESHGRRLMQNGEPYPEAKLYWNYLGACHWLWDAQMMREMAEATGRDSERYEAMAERARKYIRENFFSSADGLVLEPMRGMQTPALYALKFGLVEGEPLRKTKDALRANFAAHGDCFQTGFLGTAILMETLCANGMSDMSYTLLLQHKNPSWLYSVDQGATTIWERWNSYTKETGFGPVKMNSFNHYAYGAVLAWMYKDMAGIAADPKAPGFKNIVMAPKPDRRMGWVDAEYKSARGTIKSRWRYEGDKWTWDFEIPSGSTADVTLPDGSGPRRYEAGNYSVTINCQ